MPPSSTRLPKCDSLLVNEVDGGFTDIVGTVTGTPGGIDILDYLSLFANLRLYDLVIHS